VAIPAAFGVVALILVPVIVLVCRRRKRSQPEDDRIELRHSNEKPVAQLQRQAAISELEQLLLAEGFGLAKSITKQTAITEADKICKDLVIVFESHGKTVDLIRVTIGQEVKAANHAGSLMRANSMASKLMKSYSSMIGKEFLKKVLGDEIRPICRDPNEGGAGFEINPDKISDSEQLAKNQVKLQITCSRVLRKIFESTADAPLPFRHICNSLQSQVAAKFPESAQSCVGGFIFLRFFCPAIVAPSAHGITPDPPDAAAQRGLTSVAKCLQNIANNVTFGKKEQYLEWLNPFIKENFIACQDYFDEMAILPISKEVTIQQPIIQKTKNKSMENLFRHIKTIFEKIREKSETRDFFPKLERILRNLRMLEDDSPVGSVVSSTRTSVANSAVESMAELEE